MNPPSVSSFATILSISFRAIALLAALAVSACATHGGASGVLRSSTSKPVSLDGFRVYQPITYISAVPFIVIEATSTRADPNLDYHLRDELMRVGFPKGITSAQLSKVYVDAGLADTTPYTDDPISMRRLAEVVGPFLRLSVHIEPTTFGARFDLELWDVTSATPVLAASGYRVVWWSISKDIGADIVSALARWRDDSLLMERDQLNRPAKSQS